MNATAEREAWLQERRSGIGGSDAAAVLGISPWATPVTVWLDKTGRAAPKEETEAMRIGTELEDFVARRYSVETGRTVRRYNKMIHRGCLLGNFDRLVVPEGEKVASHLDEVRTDTLLECKTASREWDGMVPLHYQTQVQHYMGLVERLQHADVAVLFLGRKHFEIHRVERDDEVIGVMQKRIGEWWDEFVVGDKMPPPTNEADCKLLWARSNPGKSVTVNDEVAELVRRYASAKRSEQAAKADAAEIMGRICAYLGDAVVLAGADGRPLVTWKSSKDTAKTDWEGLCRWLWASNHTSGLPVDFVEKFTKTAPGARRFLVKAPSED